MRKPRLMLLNHDAATLSWLWETKQFMAIGGVATGGLINLKDWDIIAFNGGVDVDPSLYGEANLFSDRPNKERDTWEKDIFTQTALSHYHFGICRGLQFLAVMNGDKLYQNIEGHNLAGNHPVRTYDGETFDATSAHHQAVRPVEGSSIKVLAAAGRTRRSEMVAGNATSVNLDQVVEAAWYPYTRSFGVQGHPEYNHATQEFQDWTVHQMLHDPQTGYHYTRQED